MPKKRLLIHDLSIEANLSPDEVLLQLWSEGIDYVHEPVDVIRKSDINRARAILGLPTRRELTSKAYWQEVFGQTSLEFSKMLADLGFQLDENKFTLPKGAVRKLTTARKALSATGAIKPKVLDVPEKLPPELPLEWQQVGRESDLRMLSYDDVLAVHHALGKDFENDKDPIFPRGVRSENLLQSAVSRPQTRIGTDRKYATVEMAAAALLHSLVMDHPFHNGNKRTGLVAMLVFLDKNGLLLTCDENELFKLVLQVAQHSIVDCDNRDRSDREVIAIAKWIFKHSRNIEKEEYPIPFRTLRKILTDFGCWCDEMHGCRVNIGRKVQQNTSFLRRPREYELTTQVAYNGEGREVPRNTVAKIRADLQLDDEHNVDSKAFYQGDMLSADDFIARYRKTLRRLARL